MRLPSLHVVATDEVVERAGFETLATELVQAGGSNTALHVRARRLDDRALYGLTEQLAAAARSAGGWCVVNGRVDVALAARAQAVQIGAGALPVRAARRVVGRKAAIGVSVHSAEEAEEGAAAGADYLVVGTVFSTPTHPEGPVGGTELVESCVGSGLPVIAIGGITAGNTARVLGAGAGGVAVVRAVWDQSSPLKAMEELLRLVAK